MAPLRRNISGRWYNYHSRNGTQPKKHTTTKSEDKIFDKDTGILNCKTHIDIWLPSLCSYSFSTHILKNTSMMGHMLLLWHRYYKTGSFFNSTQALNC